MKSTLLILCCCFASPASGQRIEIRRAGGGATAGSGLYLDGGALSVTDSFLSARRIGEEGHAAQGSGFTSYAMTALADQGGLGGPTTFTDERYTTFTCNATNGSFCGKVHTNAGSVYFSEQLKMAVRFRWVSSPAASNGWTTTRTWFAITATALSAALPPTTVSFVGLRYQHDSDTTWQCCSGSKASGAQSCTNTGVAPTQDAAHVVVLDFSDTSVFNVYMDGTLICSKTTNLPAGADLTSTDKDARLQANMTNIQTDAGVTTPAINISYIRIERL